MKQSEEIRYVILWLNLDLASSYIMKRAVISLKLKTKTQLRPQLRPFPNSLKRKLYKRANDEERNEKSDLL